MRFVIADFIPGILPQGPTWQPPAGCLGTIVLSPEASTDAPYGLCAFDDKYVPTKDQVELGAGNVLADVSVSLAMRNTVAAKLGVLSSKLSFTTADKLLHDIFLAGDPTGATGPRPMPLVGTGLAPYYLANQLVANLAYALNGPSTVGRDLLKQCHYEIYQQVLNGELPPQTHQKWLGAKLKEFNLRSDQYDQLADQRIPPSERISRQPMTAISDDFSSGNLNNWTAANGSWSNPGSSIRLDTGAAHCSILHNTALSGSDHYSQLTSTVMSGYAAVGPQIRANANGDGFSAYDYTGTSWNPTIVKLVAGNYSAILGDAHDGNGSAGYVLKINANGSTLTAYRDGSLRLTATNTSYPSNLLVGVHAYQSGAVEGDSFSADDGILPAPTVSSVSANSGPSAGGTNVTITGTGFVATPTVAFGGTSATNVVRVNSTTITCTTPAHAAGAVDVVVTNPDTQTGTGTNAFTYEAASSATQSIAAAPKSVSASSSCYSGFGSGSGFGI